MQILFPDPLMKKMRSVAKNADIPVSEVVRRATENWLERFPESQTKPLAVPTVKAGKCLIDSKDFREAAYE
ncbi:MAG: hypothetical protein GXP30_09765 [Verrucomicrobia bacterium]|nr:hypothetical protein [Verrucomicrobiota bacterium]